MSFLCLSSSLSWCCRLEAGRKCTIAFSHASCPKSHHIDTMRKKGLWCTSLISLPYLLSSRNLFWGDKKPKTETKSKSKTHKKPPKPPTLPTNPTYGLYTLKISQQDRTSPGRIHSTACDPSTPGPSLQHQSCRWALATAAVSFPAPFPMAGRRPNVPAGIWKVPPTVHTLSRVSFSGHQWPEAKQQFYFCN